MSISTGSIHQIDVGGLRRLWRGRRREALVALLTCAVGVLASVEAAVLCGALASLAALLADLLRLPPLRLATDQVRPRVLSIKRL